MKKGEVYKIESMPCGHKCYSRFCSMGIIKGQEFTVKECEPYGPIVIDVKGITYSIGRGMLGHLGLVKIGDAK